MWPHVYNLYIKALEALEDDYKFYLAAKFYEEADEYQEGIYLYKKCNARRSLRSLVYASYLQVHHTSS